eukprot:gene11295-13177_t
MIKINQICCILSVIFALSGCNNGSADQQTKRQVKTRLSFSAVKGIKYHEIKRRFSNGLSFDSIGFQQEPSWIIQFVSNDSILAYSPEKKRMLGFHLHYDHGDVYNFAKEWFRIKSSSTDSIIMQRLQVNKKEIANDIRSDVNLTFYSENYIKDHLKSSPAELQKPTKRDTAFIKGLAERANKYPFQRDSVFAARQPVELRPSSDLVSVEKLSSVDILGGKTQAYDYLYPSFRIVLKKAYKDFGYTFTVLVDEKGKMSLGTFSGEIPEFHEVRKKVLQGIISVYLQNLLKIKPGTTLGIAHASEITVTVKGIK